MQGRVGDEGEESWAVALASSPHAVLLPHRTLKNPRIINSILLFQVIMKGYFTKGRGVDFICPTC